MKNLIADLRKSNTVFFAASLILAFWGCAEFAFSQSTRGGSGTMEAPYWVREREDGVLLYESFSGQTIIDNSFFLGGLWIKDVLIKNKKVEIEYNSGAVSKRSGYYNEDSILQVYDIFGFKMFDGSHFKRWYIKDFLDILNPELAHQGK